MLAVGLCCLQNYVRSTDGKQYDSYAENFRFLQTDSCHLRCCGQNKILAAAPVQMLEAGINKQVHVLYGEKNPCCMNI